MTAEQTRLQEAAQHTEPWKKWGPYLGDRQWGTVREDYSRDGNAWGYFPFQHAHRRAYRWGEDGLGGISDDKQRLCVALALWNGKDPILKERLFGLANEEGNHGEDVKEAYFHLDATPSHSYLKFLYKYPQAEYPYRDMHEGNRRRSRLDPEYELADAGVFDGNRYFDVFVEYAKATGNDILMRVTAHNRGPDAAPLHILPHIWYRNTWNWTEDAAMPMIRPDGATGLRLFHPEWDDYRCHFDGANLSQILVCDNESNPELFGPAKPGYWKDGINNAVLRGDMAGVNPEKNGTKAAGHYKFDVPAGGSVSVRMRMRFIAEPPLADPFADFDDVFIARIKDADEFFAHVQKDLTDDDRKLVHRQAIAGLIWTKQYFEYDVWRWIKGDPAQPVPPVERKTGRNSDWEHLKNADVISMPDKWEYPWYASWDLAFHTLPLATVDADFAKEQLLLFLREWYMHPNGQLPAYEWNFGDANPPVHGWACWRVFQIDRKQNNGKGDFGFLERAFHKLMLNFTWWVNRKDAAGNNVFQGGFLGLDNIGVFDRSNALPRGGLLEQADATSWMGMYCLNLLAIALELSTTSPSYQDVANKFFEHFLLISHAMTEAVDDGVRMWNEEDGFFYDMLHLAGRGNAPMRVRSMVGLIPIFAVETIEEQMLERFPAFVKRAQWFISNRPEFAGRMDTVQIGTGKRRLLSILDRDRLARVLARVLDETEFLSPHGVRALSRIHMTEPYEVELDGVKHRVDYEPGESSTGLFGGNSNWRGPVWFPVNYLMIEALQKYHHYYGETFRIECPTGSGRYMNLWEVASELSHRLASLFIRDANGRRAADGGAADSKMQTDPHFKDLVTFYEYFHGEDGTGLGATHQTGWTALVAKLIAQSPKWGQGRGRK